MGEFYSFDMGPPERFEDITLHLISTSHNSHHSYTAPLVVAGTDVRAWKNVSSYSMYFC